MSLEQVSVKFKGAIFDLDGVLVDTIPLHYAAWKRMFDEYGYEFDESIYRQKVDGRPRLDGVRNVMFDLSLEDAIEAGNCKQGYYMDMIKQGRLQSFATSISFLKALKSRGIVLAAASSSVNAQAILEEIGVLSDFGIVVTSADITHGKPDPEIFLTAAKSIGLSADECVVFEDAESGVEAAKRGGFFCVGIDRLNQPNYFQLANIVVKDLGDADFELIEKLF